VEEVIVPSLNEIFCQSIRKHWNCPAFSDYGVKTYTFADVAYTIERMHILFEKCGIQPGDKIALCGRNMSNWAIIHLSVLTYGAVAVPILHEFHPNQVHDIVNHCDAKILFVGDVVWKRLDPSKMEMLIGIVLINDLSLVESRSDIVRDTFSKLDEILSEKYPNGLTPEVLSYYVDKADELAMINYTSGTTSNSKGVMIPYRSVWSNYDFAVRTLGYKFHIGENMLSILPLAHMYGMMFEFLFEFIQGVHTHFLTRVASPTILLQALKEVKPLILIMVPLILEKVVRKSVMPQLQDPKIRLMMKIPILSHIVKNKIRRALEEAFGGRFYEVIIGGAGINQEIETLLKKIGFRYTVGYGATECAPIICYEDYKTIPMMSCGKAVIHMEVKIDSKDPMQIPGEILTRGLNVMLGYYKNEEATEATIDKDGWYHTGDLGVFDKHNNLYIKGRIKNMLLGANGQNVYPEEIEDKLNNMPLVAECVVIQKSEKLYGLVYPDQDQIKQKGLSQNEVEDLMEQNRKELNINIPSYAQLTGIRIMEKEFEKTPKKSIKRFLYANSEI